MPASGAAPRSSRTAGTPCPRRCRRPAGPPRRSVNSCRYAPLRGGPTAALGGAYPLPDGQGHGRPDPARRGGHRRQGRGEAAAGAGGERWRADALTALGHAETALGRKRGAQAHWREALAVHEASASGGSRTARLLRTSRHGRRRRRRPGLSRTADTARTGTALRDLTAAVRTLTDQLRLQTADKEPGREPPGPPASLHTLDTIESDSPPTGRSPPRPAPHAPTSTASARPWKHSPRPRPCRHPRPPPPRPPRRSANSGGVSIRRAAGARPSGPAGRVVERGPGSGDLPHDEPGRAAAGMACDGPSARSRRPGKALRGRRPGKAPRGR